MKETSKNKLSNKDVTMEDRFINTYTRTGLVLDHGAGARLYATDGNEYIDFMAGIGVSSLGHGYPKLVAAIAEQASKLIHVSNYFITEPSIKLAQELTDATGYDKVFFCNSGAEANEGMFKLVRKYGSSKNPDKNVIVTLKQSFHCLLYTSDAADDLPCVDLGGRRIIKKNTYIHIVLTTHRTGSFHQHSSVITMLELTRS